MATLLGIAAGTLLTGLALSAFGDSNAGANSNTYTATFSNVTESLSNVMQSALQETNQSAEINQQISLKDVDLSLCERTNIENYANFKMQAVGTFNSQSAATIQNAVNQAITNDLTNNSNITTSFLSWLPKNTTLTDLNQTMHSIVRNVYTAENLNSMKQSILANQVINLNGVKVGGVTCNISNKFSAEMLAQQSLQALSNAMFSNSFTQEAMNSIKNKYTATARGPLDFLGDIGKIIAYAVIGIVAIIVVLVVVGLFVKLATGKSAPPPVQQQPNNALTTALLASAL